MSGLRKFFGFFILLFIALPVLFGIIWAVGLTQAFVSPQVITELPKNVARALPQVLNDAVDAADRGDWDFRPETRVWLRAVKQAGMTPKEVLEKSGFIRWIEVDLSAALGKVGDALKGRRELEDVTLDLRPLKQALASETAEQYFLAVAEHLPPCDPNVSARWQNAVIWGDDVEWGRLPPCRPDPETIKSVLKLSRDRMNREIPDEIHLFENIDRFPRHLDWAGAAVTFSYLLFLIPAGFILLGALIACRDRQQFFRWSGAFILAGGLLALGSVYLTHHFSDWVVGGFPVHFWDRVSWAGDYMYQRLGGDILDWLQPIFRPVKDVSEVVAVIGLLIFALSFVLAPPRRREPAAPPAPAQLPAAPPPQA